MTPETHVESVRCYLSRRFIQRVVKGHNLAEIFFASQSWAGYAGACESWHSAYWKFVDSEITPESRKAWDAFKPKWKAIQFPANILQIERDGFRLPTGLVERQEWLAELCVQERFQQQAVFQVAMRGPESRDPQTYHLFADDIFAASKSGDTAYSAVLAKQKGRKPAKGKGDRRLKELLLVHWIACCLWAFTNEGIADLLNRLYPRSGGGLYHDKVISRTCRSLGLYHSPAPPYWGLTGEFQLVPRR